MLFLQLLKIHSLTFGSSRKQGVSSSSPNKPLAPSAKRTTSTKLSSLDGGAKLVLVCLYTRRHPRLPIHVVGVTPRIVASKKDFIEDLLGDFCGPVHITQNPYECSWRYFHSMSSSRRVAKTRRKHYSTFVVEKGCFQLCECFTFRRSSTRFLLVMVLILSSGSLPDFSSLRTPRAIRGGCEGPIISPASFRECMKNTLLPP